MKSVSSRPWNPTVVIYKLFVNVSNVLMAFA